MNMTPRSLSFGPSKTVVAINQHGDVTVSSNPWISVIQEASLVLEVTRTVKNGIPKCKIEIVKNRWGEHGDIKNLMRSAR